MRSRGRDAADFHDPAAREAQVDALFAELIRRVIDSLPWAVLVGDEGRRVIAVNRRFCDLFLPDETPEALIGRDHEDVWRRAHRLFEDVEGFLAETDAQAESRSPVIAELVPLADRRTVQRSYVPLKAEDAGFVAHLWIHSDVTSERRAEEHRNQARNLEAIGRLAGGIAHDLNNALTAIMGHASLLGLDLEEGPRRPELAESVTEIREAAQRAATLTRKLLAFGRKQVLQPRRVDPADVVRRVRDLIVGILGDDIELIVELPASPAAVRVDAVKLEHALLDLAVNARDSMPSGGRLAVTLRYGEISAAEVPELAQQAESRRYAILSVADTGTGISEEVRSKIFEPFFSTKPWHEGPGLGLATVYGFVKQSGGHVWAESQGAGGATIHVALPLIADPATPDARSAASTAAAARAPRRAPATILVAEDEPSVLSLLRRALENRGHRVLAAGDGVEALEILDRNGGGIDLLITDAVMPRMDGVELARRVRALSPALPVLVTSGYAPDLVRHVERIPGQTRLLEKPFAVTDVVRAVEEILMG